jgi:hypothetical protein
MINRDMARHGVLLLTFGFILFGVPPSETPTLPFVPPPPTCFSTALRWVLIAASFLVILLVSWTLRKYKLTIASKGRLKAAACLVASLVLVLLLALFMLWLMPPSNGLFTVSGIIAILISLPFMVAVFWKRWAGKVKNFLEGQFQYPYWLIFWVVYMVTWGKGLLSTPQGLAFKLAFWVGVVWFCVITIIMFRSTQQPSRGFRKLEIFVTQHVESPEEANPP